MDKYLYMYRHITIYQCMYVNACMSISIDSQDLSYCLVLIVYLWYLCIYMYIYVYLYQTKYLCVLYFVTLQTALMRASINGHKDIVDTLLAHKADVNIQGVRIIFNRLICHRYIYHIIWSHTVVFILILSLHSATYV